MKRFLLLIAVIVGFVTYASAQYDSRTYTDVIYTNEGLILQGTIVDQIPGVSYTIVTLDGKTYTVDALSVKRITKEPVSGGLIAENHTYYHNPYIVHTYDEEGNPIFPLSPATAFMSSLIIPGLGQFNNGEEVKGILLFSGAMVGILGMTVGANMVGYDYNDLVGYSSAALLAGCYLYSLFEAPIFAARWNKKYGFKNTGRGYVRISPAIGVTGYGHTSDAAVGMNLSLSF